MIHEFPMIPRPVRPTEFELQAELYFRLKRLGLDVRGEVPARFQGRISAFDLVVFAGEMAAVLIEVKNSDHKAVLYGKKTRQKVKYGEYGLPLVYFTTATAIEDVIASVQSHLNEIGGRGFA